MLGEQSLTAALANIGYRRLQPDVYRADWSTEVEHFIYLDLYGTPKEFLAVDFGMRSTESERFALQSFQKYGPSFAQRLWQDERIDCYMRFPLGLLVGDWGMRWSLTISAMSGQSLAAKVRRDIEHKLFPIIRKVTDLEQLASFLLQDVDPWIWARSNGALRAAIIIDLMRRAGKRPVEIRAPLEPHFRQIGFNTREAPDPRPESFVERVIQDSFSQSR
jgi:hypothetical protein